MDSNSYKKDINQVIDAFKKGSHAERHQALIDLAGFPFEDIRDVLYEALKDNNHRIRSTAAKIMGRMGDETVVPPILHLLYEDSWIIRSSAQEALSQLPSRIALPAFRGILSASGDVTLRKNIASVLSHYEIPEATDILVQMYDSSVDEDLRATVVEYLGRRKEDMAVKTLFDALSDQSWNVRSAASKALINMDVQAIIDRATKLLGNPNRNIHMAVIEILIRHGNDDVIDSMAQVLVSDNVIARLNALSVLAGINSEESLAMIVSALGDVNSSIRRKAIDSLANSHSVATFQLLKRCVKSENWNLRQGSIKALGLIGGDEAMDILENLLETGNSAIKLLVLEALAGINSNRSIRMITDNISLPDLGPDVIRIIKALDPDQSIPHLISFLTEPNYFAQTMSALKEIDRPKVLRHLVSKIAMGSPAQQIAAVEALTDIGGLEAEQYLIKISESGYSQEVNLAIGKAIEKIQKRLK
jgi:HEAT repeat protein